jgi:DNA-binding GntR family transcriptional regulator
LSDQVADTIKEQILNIELKPGQRLIVEKLAKELGVSRTPVREGLRKLTSEGLVDYDGKVYAVKELTKEHLISFFEVRRALEALAARKAAQHIKGEQLAELTNLLAKGRKWIIEQENQYIDIIFIDIEFHGIISDAAQNYRLKNLLSIMQEQSWYIRRWLLLPRRAEKVRKQTLEEHQAILDRLSEHDQEGAAQAMVRHLLKGEQRNLERIKN